MNELSRREIFKLLAAGAVMTAGGLWIPGRKLISIPRKVCNLMIGKAQTNIEELQLCMGGGIYDMGYFNERKSDAFLVDNSGIMRAVG